MKSSSKVQKDNQVQEAKNKAQLTQMVAEWPGLSVVDYRTPSGRAFGAMDRAFEEMAADPSQKVRYIRANLEDAEFRDMQDEIPSNPHYRFFKNSKTVDHLDGAYVEDFKAKVEANSKPDE